MLQNINNTKTKTLLPVTNVKNNNGNERNTNQLVVPSAEKPLEMMKNEIAQEFGVTLGADTTARANGSVGGEMTKRMVKMAQEKLAREAMNNNTNIH